MGEEKKESILEPESCKATIHRIISYSKWHMCYLNLPPGMEHYQPCLFLNDKELADLVNHYVKDGENACISLVGLTLRVYYKNKDQVERFEPATLVH